MAAQIGDERLPYFRDLIGRLDETQRDILTSLRDRGPGLAMDIAVRVLLFPDEISRPLRDLQELSLVRARPFTGAQMGAELFSLTIDGEQVVRLLREPEFMKSVGMRGADTAPAAAVAPVAPAFDPRLEQIELLKRRADLAIKRGDEAAADKFLSDAQDIAQQLSAAS